MDSLLAAALAALDVTEPPQPLTAHHTNAWRTTEWKIKTAVQPLPRRPWNTRLAPSHFCARPARPP
ncbi:hypothetical protein ACWGR4_33205 [Embleya sp. NPDC055664]